MKRSIIAITILFLLSLAPHQGLATVGERASTSMSTNQKNNQRNSTPDSTQSKKPNGNTSGQDTTAREQKAKVDNLGNNIVKSIDTLQNAGNKAKELSTSQQGGLGRIASYLIICGLGLCILLLLVLLWLVKQIYGWEKKERKANKSQKQEESAHRGPSTADLESRVKSLQDENDKLKNEAQKQDGEKQNLKNEIAELRRQVQSPQSLQNPPATTGTTSQAEPSASPQVYYISKTPGGSSGVLSREKSRSYLAVTDAGELRLVEGLSDEDKQYLISSIDLMKLVEREGFGTRIESQTPGKVKIQGSSWELVTPLRLKLED